ncbi:hypothetical protein CCHR01_18141 [Colletotrichum chrysophilum]|uniref:Uncharacterized protein n=1 Tax=Colletotrichum chrysophilum TaxID=1836956 RepID=A0AAD9A0W1_9PEZI|nr:hypothetical protein CCHR01_18141 [Colletotrichum chrysophilum]
MGMAIRLCNHQPQPTGTCPGRLGKVRIAITYGSTSLPQAHPNTRTAGQPEASLPDYGGISSPQGQRYTHTAAQPQASAAPVPAPAGPWNSSQNIGPSQRHRLVKGCGLEQKKSEGEGDEDGEGEVDEDGEGEVDEDGEGEMDEDGEGEMDENEEGKMDEDNET